MREPAPGSEGDGRQRPGLGQPTSASRVIPSLQGLLEGRAHAGAWRRSPTPPSRRGVATPARLFDLAPFPSNARAAGITVYELARIMGTSVSMIEAHYAHSSTRRTSRCSIGWRQVMAEMFCRVWLPRRRNSLGQVCQGIPASPQHSAKRPVEPQPSARQHRHCD